MVFMSIVIDKSLFFAQISQMGFQSGPRAAEIHREGAKNVVYLKSGSGEAKKHFVKDFLRTFLVPWDCSGNSLVPLPLP